MSLYEFLLQNRTKEQLAKELVKVTHENAALRDKAGALEVEIFWMKAKERDGRPDQ